MGLLPPSPSWDSYLRREPFSFSLTWSSSGIMFPSVDDCVWQSANVLLVGRALSSVLCMKMRENLHYLSFGVERCHLQASTPAAPTPGPPNPFLTHGLAMYSLQRITYGSYYLQCCAILSLSLSNKGPEGTDYGPVQGLVIYRSQKSFTSSDPY